MKPIQSLHFLNRSAFALASFAVSGFGVVVAPAPLHAQPALTIYNQNFAVVRDTVHLDLKAGVTEQHFANVTAQLEPDSVILRDPTGKVSLQILEQNYRNDPVSQPLMLSLFEGKTIEFLHQQTNKPDEHIQGKIIRSGYVPGGRDTQPIIEVDGKLQFQLPGMPIFPALANDTILKPELIWKIESAKPAKLDAEIAYVTNGMNWHATYNIVTPENGDNADLVGWITIKNQSGKVFKNAKIKLMAGDVHRVHPMAYSRFGTGSDANNNAVAVNAPVVTQKSFSEYHLYTLAHPTTLQDQETKQVEFVQASGIQTKKIYTYDSTHNAKKVAVQLEFKNSKENHLGIPLPEGRFRIYQQSDDKQLEFIGEDNIDHTPKDEKVKLTMGYSFDLTAERKLTDHKGSSSEHWATDSYEIKLHNHKKKTVEIRVVEHLRSFQNWKIEKIEKKSMPYERKDAQTIEFPVSLKPDEEKMITYTVHYSW